MACPGHVTPGVAAGTSERKPTPSAPRSWFDAAGTLDPARSRGVAGGASPSCLSGLILETRWLDSGSWLRKNTVASFIVP
jgi:hypothetical protein